MRVMTQLVAGSLLAFVVAACSAAPAGPGVPGSSGLTPPGVSSAPGQPAGVIDACAVLSDAEIKAAALEGVGQRRQSTLTQVFPSVCDIVLEDGGSLTVSVLATGGRAMYETSFEPFIGDGESLDEAVPGVGDKAARSGSSSLMVLKGDVLFDLQLLNARPDRMPALQYLAERIIARLPCIATGCPDMPLPPAPTIGPPTAAPTQALIDPGSLPSTGAQTRVVNLYSESGVPVAVDVYAYAYSEAGMGETGALVATVPYGTASDWFNPGLVQSPFSTNPYTKIDIYRQGDQSQPLAGVSEFLGSPGTVATIAIWQEEFTEGQPSAWAQTIYASHPTNTVATPLAGQALLASNNAGLKAEDEEPVLFASVGDGCLESPFGRSDPDIPNAQPVGNDLVMPVGDHTLTVHESPPGELATCDTKALGPGVPVTVAAGDRLLMFPYRLSETDEVNLLVIPFGAP